MSDHERHFWRVRTGRSSHSWLFLISSDGSVKSDIGMGNPGMALWRWKPNVTNQMFTSAWGGDKQMGRVRTEDVGGEDDRAREECVGRCVSQQEVQQM